MSKPSISVIMPIYNTEMYLKEAIESIYNQTYSSWELFLVDDGSTDNSGCICDEYANKDLRISVIHTDNKGVSEARNIALDKAVGEWICFIDSDDIYESNAFENLLKYSHNADIVMGENSQKNTLWNTISCRKDFIPKECTNMDIIDLYNCFFFHVVWGKMYRKSSLHYKFDTKMILGEDTKYNLQHFYEWNKIVLIPETVYNHRIREDSLSEKFCFDLQDKLVVLIGIWEQIFPNCCEIHKKLSDWYIGSMYFYVQKIVWHTIMDESLKKSMISMCIDKYFIGNMDFKAYSTEKIFANFWNLFCMKDIQGVYNLFTYK